MFKVAIILATVCIAIGAKTVEENRVMTEGLAKQNTASDDLIKIAQWTISPSDVNNPVEPIASKTQIKGSLSVTNIRNIQAQVFAGVKYYFTYDLLLAGGTGNFSCDLIVFKEWTNIITINSASCTKVTQPIKVKQALILPTSDVIFPYMEPPTLPPPRTDHLELINFVPQTIEPLLTEPHQTQPHIITKIIPSKVQKTTKKAPKTQKHVV